MKFVSHKDEVLTALTQQMANALEICGGFAESRAKEYSEPIDTGRLRNSISHRVDGDTAYIGTNVEYAPYIELGTGVFYGGGEGGRQSPWGYDGKSGVRFTRGIPARHFLKHAVTDHTDTYKKILEDGLKH